MPPAITLEQTAGSGRLGPEMCESYDDWVEEAEEAIRNFTKNGAEVHKVDVGVEEFLKWATKENVPITRFARSNYASRKLGEAEMKRLTRSDRPLPSRDCNSWPVTPAARARVLPLFVTRRTRGCRHSVTTADSRSVPSKPRARWANTIPCRA